MRAYILFDDSQRDHLLPLTFTRPVSELRIGILTISEKWRRYLNAPISHLTQPYLSAKYPAQSGTEHCLINGRICPTPELTKAVEVLKPGEALVKGSTTIALTCSSLPRLNELEELTLNKIEFTEEYTEIRNLWDIFRLNGEAISNDYRLLTANRKSEPIPSSNRVIAPDNIFIEKGARVECAILNAENGPIYIGSNAEVMEGAIIRGPFALGEHSAVKMGAKIYGPTTIGPHCKVGGEINNSVFWGYSNKAHDGFLGNSVIGEWCNIGADSNNSNLKNNYAIVKLWNYPERHFIPTGLQFCGLIMADHSKCGINTMFNTGTVVGVCCNIYGSGFPRNFIPSFAWGGANGLTIHKPEKAFETASIMMARRNIELTETDREILSNIFEQTACFRKF